MADVEPGVACLQIPMMFESYEELDYVRDHIAPRLEKMIEAHGFVVLNWGDAGWVHFFTLLCSTEKSCGQLARCCPASGRRIDLYSVAKRFTRDENRAGGEDLIRDRRGLPGWSAKA